MTDRPANNNMSPAVAALFAMMADIGAAQAKAYQSSPIPAHELARGESDAARKTFAEANEAAMKVAADHQSRIVAAYLKD